jgi:hypothetical protein
MQVETDEPEVIERVAALDVGKAEVVCCARVPGPRGQRMQEVRTTSTMTSALLALGDWLAGLGVTRVVMEATGDYWRAPFYLLEDASRRGWSTPMTSCMCPAGPRPTGWTRFGCARSPSGRCCDPASCRRRRSGNCCAVWQAPDPATPARVDMLHLLGRNCAG